MLPYVARRANPGSSAISQSTLIRPYGMPPRGSSGRTASRVQRITLSGSGSPEATPSWKG